MSGAPGATVLATEPPKPPASKPVPAWKHLRKLLPYIARSKGQVAIGMLTNTAMGIVGTLQPLAFGVIMDCLSGNPQPLGRLSQVSPRLVHLLIPAYAPSSVRTLIIYCVAAVVIVALKGLFSFSLRRIAMDDPTPGQPPPRRPLHRRLLRDYSTSYARQPGNAATLNGPCRRRRLVPPLHPLPHDKRHPRELALAEVQAVLEAARQLSGMPDAVLPRIVALAHYRTTGGRRVRHLSALPTGAQPLPRWRCSFRSCRGKP